MTKRQKYGIRKYKIGAASIALGTVVAIGMTEGNEAKASEISTTEVTSNTTEDTSNNTNELKVQPLESTENNMNFDIVRDSKNESTNEKLNESVVSNTGVNSRNTIVKPSNLVSRENVPKEAEAPSVITVPVSVDDSTKETYVGQDVTNKVKVDESSIKGQDGKVEINPHEAERVTLKYKWTFDEGINPGDYFDFTISDNVDTKGISSKRKMPDIIDNTTSEPIAQGMVRENGTLRYIFTDYVSKRSNINANLSLNLFFKPSVVFNDGFVDVESTIGTHVTKSNFKVTYLDGVKDSFNYNLVVNGRIDTLDKEQNNFTHYAYINPNKEYMRYPLVIGLFNSGAPITSENPKVSIYKYVNTQKPLARSVYVDLNTSDFENVTDKLNIKYDQQGMYSVSLGQFSNDTYIIKYEGNYNSRDPKLVYRTQLRSYLGYNGGIYNTLTWDNSVVLYSNKANGNGKDKPLEPIYGFSEPINFETTTYKPEVKASNHPIIETFEDSFPVETLTESGSDFGDSNYQTIEETEDTIHVDTDDVSHINTNHNADVVEIEEDSNPGGGSTHHTSNVVEFDEDSATGVVTGAITDHTIVEDTMEYITENNLIELEDDHTLPPHITGQAEGSIEEIEENSVIDINDFTMIDGDHGELTGVLEETDENHYIDINEYTMTEGSHGQATGIIEETEEYQHADILEMTTPIGENGATQGIIEEVEDSNLIEFDEETGNGAISGHVIGAVEEIEDSFYISTLSESGIEQGSNGSDTFVEDTSEDKPSVKTNSPDPIEIVEEIPRENGYTKGMIIEEDTKPPHIELPSVSDKEKPLKPEKVTDIPLEKKENVVPNTRGNQYKEISKVKSEKRSNHVLVSKTPKFKPVNSINKKNSSDSKIVQNQTQQLKPKELPNTGNNSDKNPLLFGGLISLIGLAFIRRNMKEKINF
ncbi:fibrinogen-binding adhesin SdrG C-terminal domain-containing protein [Staphylococcus agnetis]|uniref:fibronectin-binding protein FnbA n=1 Tax=Staphylococcus agnetis TaxID=985762 RepID=UPI0039EC154F